MKIIILVSLFLFSVAHAKEILPIDLIHQTEKKIKSAKKIEDKMALIKILKEELSQTHSRLTGDEKPQVIDAIDYDVAFGPIFSADFSKDKQSCTENGPKHEILFLFNSGIEGRPLPPSATQALQFLAAICKKPGLAKITK
jgi:hypothetical protein